MLLAPLLVNQKHPPLPQTSNFDNPPSIPLLVFMESSAHNKHVTAFCQQLNQGHMQVAAVQGVPGPTAPISTHETKETRFGPYLKM
jgi:hypothetical protein